MKKKISFCFYCLQHPPPIALYIVILLIQLSSIMPSSIALNTPSPLSYSPITEPTLNSPQNTSSSLVSRLSPISSNPTTTNHSSSLILSKNSTGSFELHFTSQSPDFPSPEDIILQRLELNGQKFRSLQIFFTSCHTNQRSIDVS